MPKAPELGRNFMKTQGNLACVIGSDSPSPIDSAVTISPNAERPTQNTKVDARGPSAPHTLLACGKLGLMSRPCMWRSRGRTCDTGKREK